MNIRELLEKNEYIMLDGAMGTMLQASGLKLGGIPELLNITDSELITDIHRKYVESGSQIIYANTFGANRHKLSRSDKTVTEVITSAITNAKKACDGTECYVALDIGPIGQLLEPTGSLSFEEAYDIFSEQIIAGANAGADLVVFETMTDLYEVKAAVLAAKENSNLPIMVTMTFEENRRTFTGTSIASMAALLNGLNVDAMGLNCSLGPAEFLPLVEELTALTNIPVIVKPNAGLPDPYTNTYNVTPEEFSGYMKGFTKYGVRFYGGCCGTDPSFIKATLDMLKQTEILKNTVEIKPVICTPTNAVVIDCPRIIGERINPTGKKLFKEALKSKDINYILTQALDQVHAGADILDVNVGLPGIDEKEMMITTIKALQSVVDVPLQIDTTNPEVLEAALRIYNGKPIINSVNGEEESLSSVLPLAKKYGAAVVGLTLDKGGIPKLAKDRFAVAKKIMDRAISYGIPKEDVYIDCLTLTASAEQEGVIETLNAVKMVKDILGLKTVLGVSNISFGLPNRELVNSTFLTMALQNGLDLPIINPNVTSMTGAVRAYKVLNNIDKNSIEYINSYNNYKPTAVTKDTEMTLQYAIDNGLKSEGGHITKRLLETTDAMEIINTILVPALDKAGAEFEKGKIFLPQLILAAEVAQACFTEIKANLSKSDSAPVSKGKIVLATVKGDIHDIGKNIVKVLLENYGYTVVDLGKDVDYQAVVDAVKKDNIKLVGLSALMTTTLVSMQKTIELIHENKLDCKIMVGGAVLTPDYAMEIGADFYAKDAKESVDIAKKILG